MGRGLRSVSAFFRPSLFEAKRIDVLLRNPDINLQLTNQLKARDVAILVCISHHGTSAQQHAICFGATNLPRLLFCFLSFLAFACPQRDGFFVRDPAVNVAEPGVPQRPGLQPKDNKQVFKKITLRLEPEAKNGMQDSPIAVTSDEQATDERRKVSFRASSMLIRCVDVIPAHH